MFLNGFLLYKFPLPFAFQQLTFSTLMIHFFFPLKKLFFSPGNEYLCDDSEAIVPSSRSEALASSPDKRHQPSHGALGVSAGPGRERGGHGWKAPGSSHNRSDARAPSETTGHDRGEDAAIFNE